MLASPRCCWCGYWCCVCVNTAPLPHYLPESEHVRDTKKTTLHRLEAINAKWEKQKPFITSEMFRPPLHRRSNFLFFFFKPPVIPQIVVSRRGEEDKTVNLFWNCFLSDYSPETMDFFFLLSHSLTLFWKKNKAEKSWLFFADNYFTFGDSDLETSFRFTTLFFLDITVV